jgi:hypothetical protein
MFVDVAILYFHPSAAAEAYIDPAPKVTLEIVKGRKQLLDD